MSSGPNTASPLPTQSCTLQGGDLDEEQGGNHTTCKGVGGLVCPHRTRGLTLAVGGWELVGGWVLVGGRRGHGLAWIIQPPLRVCDIGAHALACTCVYSNGISPT